MKTRITLVRRSLQVYIALISIITINAGDFSATRKMLI